MLAQAQPTDVPLHRPAWIVSRLLICITWYITRHSALQKLQVKPNIAMKKIVAKVRRFIKISKVGKTSEAENVCTWIIMKSQCNN